MRRLLLASITISFIAILTGSAASAQPPAPTRIPTPTFLPTPTPLPTMTPCPTLTPMPTPTARATPTPLPTAVFPVLATPIHGVGDEFSPGCALTYSVYYYSQTASIDAIWLSATQEISASQQGLNQIAVWLGLTGTGETWAPGIFSGTTAYSATAQLTANIGEMVSWIYAIEQLGMAGIVVGVAFVYLAWILFILVLKVVIAVVWELFEVIRRLWEAIPFIG